MTFIYDFWLVIWNSIVQIITEADGLFWFALSVGLVFAALTWWLCGQYGKLWNKKFQMQPAHHLIGFFSGLITLFFVLAFVGMQDMLIISKKSFFQWHNSLMKNQSWNQQLLKENYEQIKNLQLEDFSQYPPPNQGGKLIPTKTNQSIELSATKYSNEAVQHFKQARPFLNLILNLEEQIDKSYIQIYLEKNYSKNIFGSFPIYKGVNLAEDWMLQHENNNSIWIPRLILVGIFLVIQGFVLGIMGFMVYKQLKATF